MSDNRKLRIAAAFERAPAYDANARIQRVAADRLAARLEALPTDIARPALEIGCGTGFLTEALAARYSALTVSDIAPAMLARTRARIGDRPGLAYKLIDGEHPGPAPLGGWGLIASSLAFQWFENPAEAIARLVATLAPGGWLAFNTLAPGSFAEWHGALETAGLAAAVRHYADPATLHPTGEVTTYTLTETHPSGLAFLRALKAIGAGTAWHRTKHPARLRTAITAFESAGATISYEIAEVLIQS